MVKKIQNVHKGYAYNRDLILMTLPLLLMSFFYYGPRCLLLAGIAVLSARVCDWVVAVLRSRRYDRTECSSVTFALLIVLMMPANVPIRVLVAAVLMAVLVAKEAFGGYGSYPFHPVAVGVCMAAVSWPEYVLKYPPLQVWFMAPQTEFAKLMDLWGFKNVTTVDELSYSLKLGGLPDVDLRTVFLGNYAGALGITSVVVVLACAAFLLVRGRINLTTPLCFLGAVFLAAFFFPRVTIAPHEGDVLLLLRLKVVGYELLTGTTIFGAFFLAGDPGVQPSRNISRAIYGILLGVGTIMFRYFGIYELGACFAILIVNALSGFIGRVGRSSGMPEKEVLRL